MYIIGWPNKRGKRLYYESVLLTSFVKSMFGKWRKDTGNYFETWHLFSSYFNKAMEVGQILVILIITGLSPYITCFTCHKSACYYWLNGSICWCVPRYRDCMYLVTQANVPWKVYLLNVLHSFFIMLISLWI